MPTDRKFTYTRRSKELPLASKKALPISSEEKEPEVVTQSSRGLSGYEKSDGILSYSIVCVISGGERKERDFLRLLIKQKELHTLRVAFISKERQGLQPYQMQDKWEEIQNKKEFNIEGVSYQLDSMDKVFLLSDVDEFYNQLKTILGKKNDGDAGQWIISNPCFEIWLYYCFRGNPAKDLSSIESLPTAKRSQEMKCLGNTIVSGGLNPLLAFENMEKGIDNSVDHYNEDENTIPVLYSTQMHEMAKFLIDTMNRNAGEYSDFIRKKREWRECMRKNAETEKDE